ncbi:MAG: hypothetical protein Kow0089_17330 [Desulfobulbaceae bacterium]
MHRFHASLPSRLIKAGFTTVEVMITLVIIAIAAALTGPAILSMAPNMALKTAAQDLFSNIQEAKITAIKENRDVFIQIGTDGYTIGEEFTDTNGNGIFDGGDVFDAANDDDDGDGAHTADKTIVFANEYEYSIGLGTGNATQTWTGGGIVQSPRIQFTARGTAQTPGTVYIDIGDATKDTGVCYAIEVTVAGGIKSRKYDGTTPFNQNNWVL